MSTHQFDTDRPSQLVFWGCFIALITTAFAFISRTFMINTPGMWPAAFGLDKVQSQVLFGAGIWPFAVSIILFSLVIDRIGYRVAMIFSFICYLAYAALALLAHSTVSAAGLEEAALEDARKLGWNYLYSGSIILGLGNGTVEAFINPVVATLFSKEKTKWLNILHAGWPGGLVLGGVLTIWLGQAAQDDWRLLIYIIAIPATIYLLMLIGAKFPVNERVAGGATYKEMLAEFGALGALLASFMIFREISGVFKWDARIVEWLVKNEWIAQASATAEWIGQYFTWGLVATAVLAYWAYCQSLGRPLMILLCLIMMPLATTELGTDGAITGIMEKPMKEAGYNPLWVLVYTASIMMVLRFFAGPIVRALTPLGLLAFCSTLAVIGLYLLSFSTTAFAIFAAATVYGIGKTFFWPTMLGIVSEQFPKGGALTLNAIAGIGMLTAGIVGGPLIGKMQEDSVKVALNSEKPGVYEKIQKEDTYFLGEYTAVDDEKLKTFPEDEKDGLKTIINTAKQSALAKVIVFPTFMLICYLLLILYFKSKGGYKAQSIGDHRVGGQKSEIRSRRSEVGDQKLS